MEDKKNSVVFFADWWDALKDLPDGMQLAAFRAVFAYAFDSEAPTDVTTKAITSVMLSTIDRNNEKWQRIREKRAEAGRKGMEARWAEKRKDKVADQALEQIDNKNNKCYQVITNDNKNNKALQNITNITVNDNVNVNVNDNINNISLSSSLQVRTRTREEILGEFFAENRAAKIEALCMSTGASLPELKAAAAEAVNDWELTSLPPHKDLRDEQAHLLAHIRKIIKNKKNNGTRKISTDNQTRDEQNERNKQHILARLAGNDKGGNFTA